MNGKPEELKDDGKDKAKDVSGIGIDAPRLVPLESETKTQQDRRGPF